MSLTPEQRQHNFEFAIENKMPETVEAMIELGADLTEVFKYGLPNTTLQIIKLLADGGAPFSNKVITDSIYKRKDRVLQYFVEKGAVIDLSNVIYAFNIVSEKTLKALIAGVVDITADNNELIKYAYKNERDEIVEHLHTRGADIDLLIEKAEGYRKEQFIQFKKKWAHKKEKLLLKPKVIKPKNYKMFSQLSDIPLDNKHSNLRKQFMSAEKKYFENTRKAERKYCRTVKAISNKDDFYSDYWIKDYRDDTYIISYGKGFSVRIILEFWLKTHNAEDGFFHMFKEKLYLLKQEYQLNNDINEIVSERTDIKSNNNPFKV